MMLNTVLSKLYKNTEHCYSIFTMHNNNKKKQKINAEEMITKIPYYSENS